VARFYGPRCIICYVKAVENRRVSLAWGTNRKATCAIDLSGHVCQW